VVFYRQPSYLQTLCVERNRSRHRREGAPKGGIYAVFFQPEKVSGNTFRFKIHPGGGGGMIFEFFNFGL
jgi:hypothetical protein